MNRPWIAGLVLGLCFAETRFAAADFRIELRDGGAVTAESYRIDGDKLLLYRSSGSFQVDRAAVKSIQERSAEPSAGAVADSPVSTPEKSAATDAASPRKPADAAASPAAAPAATDAAAAPKDPAALENELTRKLILANRELLFAQNRGEGEKSLKKRQDDIEKIQEEREQIRKLLGR